MIDSLPVSISEVKIYFWSDIVSSSRRIKFGPFTNLSFRTNMSLFRQIFFSYKFTWCFNTFLSKAFSYSFLIDLSPDIIVLNFSNGSSNKWSIFSVLWTDTCSILDRNLFELYLASTSIYWLSSSTIFSFCFTLPWLCLWFAWHLLIWNAIWVMSQCMRKDIKWQLGSG